MQIEDKKRGLRNFALRVADFNEYDFEEFFMQRTKTIKKCDKLITDIKLAESVSTILFLSKHSSYCVMENIVP